MRLRAADKAWLVLAAGILAWDIVCEDDEMLTEASRRYAKAHPVVAHAVVASVALHLTDLVRPRWADPIHIIGLGVRRLKRVAV
jgi:hypothetical protein